MSDLILSRLVPDTQSKSGCGSKYLLQYDPMCSCVGSTWIPDNDKHSMLSTKLSTVPGVPGLSNFIINRKFLFHIVGYKVSLPL